MRLATNWSCVCNLINGIKIDRIAIFLNCSEAGGFEGAQILMRYTNSRKNKLGSIMSELGVDCGGVRVTQLLYV